MKRASQSFVPVVPGFRFAGVAAGLKDDPEKKDVTLIYAESAQTTVAGVFTTNAVAAAPVRLCRKRLPARIGRLIVVNSGSANAATGPAGLAAAKAVTAFAAKSLNVPERQVFPCSTGKIGLALPVAKLKRGVARAASELRPGGFLDAAQAICTTDAYPKTALHKGKLGGREFTVAVMAKGAGMIAPNMATMLCFVATDLALEAGVAQELLAAAVGDTLNRMTVDGDTSTNDTVLLLAGGAAGNAPVRRDGKAYRQILAVLRGLLAHVATQIVLDGEGAARCFAVRVSGAKNPRDAELAARAVADSQLVKAAVHGADPNWGRILCAAGYSGAFVNEAKTVIALGPHAVFRKGRPVAAGQKPAARYLKSNRIVEIHVGLGVGKAAATVLASDLSPAYVKFNSDYHT